VRLEILYAVHAYKPAYRVGGPILSVAALAEGMAARGHRVVVFTTNSNLTEPLDVATDRPVMVDNVEVWYFRQAVPFGSVFSRVSYFSKSMGYLYTPGLSTALKGAISSFDLVHLHMPFVYPCHRTAWSAIRAGKPLFYHQRGVFDPARLRFRSLKKKVSIRALDRPIMRRAAMLFALTEAERESYRALGVQTPCRVIPNGIDTRQYRQDPNSEACSRWGIRGDDLVMLFLSRLHPIKGADVLLEAFLRIGREFSNLRLVMAGPDEWGLEREFRRRSAAAGLVERLVFPGLVTGEDKLELLARADLFCLPSVGEGFSMAVLEALASATPVMLSPGCNFPEVAAQGAGWIVPRDAESWSRAMTGVLREPSRLRAAGSAGLRLVKAEYTWGRVLAQTEGAYFDVLEQRREATPSSVGVGESVDATHRSMGGYAR
jgi:glycosyltransferase involved in cell wall biosynthesis